MKIVRTEVKGRFTLCMVARGRSSYDIDLTLRDAGDNILFSKNVAEVFGVDAAWHRFTEILEALP